MYLRKIILVLPRLQRIVLCMRMLILLFISSVIAKIFKHVLNMRLVVSDKANQNGGSVQGQKMIKNFLLLVLCLK